MLKFTQSKYNKLSKLNARFVNLRLDFASEKRNEYTYIT